MRLRLNKMSRLLAAVMALSLLNGYGVKAAFDGPSGASSFSDLKIGKSDTDLRVPVPSSATVPNEFAQFQENLGTGNGICKNAQAKLNQEARIVNVIGIGGLFGRYMKQLPTGRLALIDEVGVKLGLSVGGDTLHIPAIPVAGVAVGVSLTASMEGKSVVMRPLDSNSYCKELKTLVKLYEVKTILPLNAKRIKAMEVGEIWKLPMAFKYGFGANVGASFNEIVSVTLGASISKEEKPSVSMYRMEENKLRLRIRLDSVLIKSVGVSATTLSIPAGDMGLPATSGQIGTLVEKTLASEINKFIAFQLGYQYSHFQGKKLLLEFIIDPANESQMAGLIDFMRGDFGILKRFIELGVNFHSFAEDTEASLGATEITNLSDQANSQLGANSTFAGSDHYTGSSHNTHINVPVIHTHDGSRSSTYNRYQSLDRQGETLHVQQETKVSNGTTFMYAKHNTQTNVYVLNRESSDGTVTRPALFFQKYEGLVHRSDSASREMVDNANGVLKYVGTQGNGTTGAYSVPTALLFPPVPANPNADWDAPTPGKSYKSTLMSFKLAISEGGIQEVLFAPVRAIMKAYMNMMREVSADIIDKVMDLFTIDAKGKVDYDYRKAQKALGVNSFDSYDNGGSNPLDIVRTLAYTATRVIADIAGVRDAGGWKDQSDKLAKVTAGDNKSGLKYEEFLKVFVQVVAPANISAEVYVQTDKKIKGEQDYKEKYQFFNNRDNNFDRTIADVNQMRDRFTAPTDITD